MALVSLVNGKAPQPDITTNITIKTVAAADRQ